MVLVLHTNTMPNIDTENGKNMKFDMEYIQRERERD